MATNAPPITGLRLAASTSSSATVAFHRLAVVRVSLRSSFFGNNVGALRLSGVQLLHSNRTRCKGVGGGSLGSQMNLFDRFARVVKSYANAVLSTFEDPEKILEQTVIEMNEDLTKMRQSTAQVLASQKQLENKYKASQQASEDWYKRAQLALSKGDEELAREALKRRKSYADNASTLKAQLDQQKTVVESLVSNTKLLESKIQEAKSKKDTLKARAQSARTSTKVSEMVGKVNTSGALAAFEKMEEKVMAMESEADALNQLTSDDLEGKFALLEGSSVDEDLASLKNELSGNSKTLTKLRFSRNTFTDSEKEIFKELLQTDDFYKIRLPSNVVNLPGRNYTVSAVKARCLAREALDEHFVIHMEGATILAVNYGSPGACPYPRQLKMPSKWSFNSNPVLKYSEMAPRTPIFIEETPEESAEAEAMQQPEKSFWAKYWMYLIPLGLMVMNGMTQALTMPEEQAAG